MSSPQIEAQRRELMLAAAAMLAEKEANQARADEQICRHLGEPSPAALRRLEKISDLVSFVRSDGRAVLRDGRIVDREQLELLVTA